MLDEHVEEETVTLEYLASDVVAKVVFQGALDPLDGVRDLPNSLEYDPLPDLNGTLVGRIPDILLASEVTVEPPLSSGL